VAGRDLSPYTFAKTTNTELVRNYSRWYELPFVNVYFFNVYGPRERSGAYGTVIEIFRQQYLKNEPLEVRLPGTQQRNYTHVADTVEGLVLAGEKGMGDGYNIASEKSYGTLEVAHLFGGEIVLLPERKTSRPGTEIDTAKMNALGWRATRMLEDYIREIKTHRS